MKKKQFYDPVYDNDFLVLWDIADDDLEAALTASNRWLGLTKKGCTPYTLKDMCNCDAQLLQTIPATGYVLWFSSTPSTLDLLSWVCHETLHAAQFVFNTCGIPWSTKKTKQEPQCYYQSFLFRETVKAMNLDLPSVTIESKVEGE